MSTDRRWLLYGANGYTGRLVAAEAIGRGERPILAGRRERPVRALAEELGCEARIVELDDAAALARALDGAALVLHCAGPFSATSAPMVEACLAARVHYLDVTGEIDVFEAVRARDQEARARGVSLLPGVGLDVVPSDCLAAALARALPEATHLLLALFSPGRSSGGTLRTALEAVPRGARLRVGGAIVEARLGERSVVAPFPSGSRRAVLVPWGDVSTAYASTGIGDIETYAALPRRALRFGRWAGAVYSAVSRLGPGSSVAARLIGRSVGPSASERARGRVELFGRAVAPDGRSVDGTAVTPDGYTFTARSAVELSRRVLAGGVPAGFLTPSRAFGPELLETFEGCRLEVGPVSVRARRL